MKTKITTFIEGLILYDFLLFSGVFLFFIILIVLAILLRKKVLLGVFLVLFGFLVLIVTPIVGHMQIHKNVFKHSLELLSQKKLQFSEAVVVYGALKNESQRDFSSCKVTVAAYKVTSNKYKNYLKKLKPFLKTSVLQEDIAMGQKRDFKVILEPFRYSGEYNILLGADCR